jgi:hypothetical protein
MWKTSPGGWVKQGTPDADDPGAVTRRRDIARRAHFDPPEAVMRLEGTLDAFGLPDILQLLAFTRKSGALRLSAPPAAGVVRVRDGAICAASSDTSRQMLARRLIGAGLVGDDALRAAVQAVHGLGGPPGSGGVVGALLADGTLTADALLPLASEQTTDAVSELLRWTSGEFSFVVDDGDPDELPLGLAVDEVVAEGQRRLTVWAELTAVIPSPDVALALAVAPAEDPHCTREEWGLLALVDGTRSVTEIVVLLGRSEFAVMRALAGLVSRGLLVVPGAAGPGGGLAELQRRQALLSDLESGSHRVPSTVLFSDPDADPEPAPAPAGNAPVEMLEAAITSPAVSIPAVRVPEPVATATDGSSALAPQIDPDAYDDVTAPTVEPRPALTLAVGPTDAPVTRSLLWHVAVADTA